MLSTLLLGVAAAYLRGEPGQVALPFPDVKEAEDALVSQPEAPAPDAAPVEEQQQEAPATVSAWHMPTLKPDPMMEGADAFKHPTQEMIKDWETAPKIDMFDAPTEKPIEDPMKVQADPMTGEVEDAPKKVEAALPAVQSKLHPVNPYGKRDDNAELAAIQKESPDAYGIIKALLMKKQMGLPLPGAEAAANAQSARAEMAGERQQNPDATTGHINNMWNWKPKDSASDEVSVAQEMSDTQEAPAPMEDAAPAAVEAPAAPEAPAAAPSAAAAIEALAEPAVTEAAAPAEEAPAPAAPAAEAPASGMMAMNSWLGATVKAPAPVEREEVQVPKQGADLMSKYALDLA